VLTTIKTKNKNKKQSVDTEARDTFAAAHNT